MLRLFQIGISIADLREMTVGMAQDILIEQVNDYVKANGEAEEEASQDDFDKFAERGW
jgi:hypothetical protein